MRVVSGIYKSRVLEPIDNLDIRITTDKVKEALFDIINFKVAGSIFLDLFAGTGAIGIEAISRGAELVYFVENSMENISVIKKNIDSLKIENGKYKIISASVFDFLKNFNEKIKFDIIFLDPPFKRDYPSRFLSKFKNFSNVSTDNLIIIEHAKKERFVADGDIDIIKEKNYGEIALTILQKKN